MNTLIKRLGKNPQDIELMRKLNAIFAEAFEDTKTYSYDHPDSSYLENLLSKFHIIALVQLHKGQVVGGLVAYVLDKLEQRRSEIYIYDLAVAKAYRRQGIATQLILELKTMAADFGAWAIFVQADREDIPAIKLYEKLGVKEEPLHFDILI